jgi:hypothetical protein
VSGSGFTFPSYRRRAGTHGRRLMTPGAAFSVLGFKKKSTTEGKVLKINMFT